MRMKKIRLGGENSPCVPHKFLDGDKSSLTAVKTLYQYH
ncbi:hypothetical protein A2U01_0073271, partial [Trifolium medium]|nr:hypothetical protein [Trifolium medium]